VAAFASFFTLTKSNLCLLYVQQCAHPVFSYVFTSYSGLFIALHKCTAAHKYWILEWPWAGGAMRLKRNDWREMKELNLQH